MKASSMARRQGWTHAAALAALLLTVGCSQQYNGAWGGSGAKPAFTPAAPAQPRYGAHHPLLRDPVAQPRPEVAAEAAPVVAQAPASGVAAVRFDSPSPEAAAESYTEPFPSLVNTRSVPASNVRPLGLFGQLERTGAVGTSPLDSPDNIRRVSFAAEGADFDPDIDPTGTWIVYASTQHRKTSDLYLKRVGGSTITQLTNDPANDVMPVFSPDGKRIAFASDRAGNWDIYVMDADGGAAIQLTSDATQDLHPSFSPDGRQIVYCTHGTQSGQWELVVLDVENPAAKRFVGYGLFPSWSPVDDRIVFQRSRERGTRWFSVWTLELREGEGVRPTEIVASANAAAITPAWSPDGRRLVFCTVLDPAADEQTRPAQADMWVINADGTGRASVARNAFTNLQPVWSRDGWIYFVSNRGKGGVENVWSIKADRAVTLARHDAPADAAVLAPTETPAVEPPAAELPPFELDPTVMVPTD